MAFSQWCPLAFLLGLWMEINKGIWVNAASRVLSTGQGLILRLVFYPEHHTFDQDQGDFWIILNEASAVLFVSSQCSRNPIGRTGHSWLYLLVTQFVRLKVRSEMIPANQKIVSLMFLWIRVFQYHWYKFDLENFQLLLNSKEVAQILEVQSHDPVEAEGSVEHPPLWNSSTPHTLPFWPRQRHRLYRQPTLTRRSSEKMENK